MNYNILLNDALRSIATLRPTQIELRPGQILQGTIIKQLPDQLATVQLGGLLVTARLEATLKEGQKIWLQVQPERNPITLRLIEKPETTNTASDSAKIPAGPSLNDLTTALHISLNKEQVSFLQTLVEQKTPINVELMRVLPNLLKQFGTTKEVADALAVISKKELPLTADTISAVQAFLQNEGYANQIERILQQLTAYMQNRPEQHRNLEQHQNIEQYHNLEQYQNIEQYPHQAQQQELAQQQSATQQLAQNLIEQLHKNKEIIQSFEQHISDLFKEQNAVANPKQASQAQVQAQSPPGLKADQLITSLFQQLGIQHEHQILHSAHSHPDTIQHLENLKSAIFQLLDSKNADALPKSLKQDLNQLANHITGQQLMVTDNNTANAFVQFSLQIPLPGMQQEQNAFIHIESRKKGKQAIDQENCRLFFYLTMQHLGETALDVSIVNKILSVTLYNDQPWVPNLVQPLRKNLETHLLEKGYILSNFKTVSLPEKTQSFIQSPPDSLKNYKGVNLRI